MVFLLIPVSSTSNERNFLASYFAMNRPSSPRLELRILRAYVRGSESDGFIIRLASREVQGAKALGQGARAAGPVTARGSLRSAGRAVLRHAAGRGRRGAIPAARDIVVFVVDPPVAAGRAPVVVDGERGPGEVARIQANARVELRSACGATNGEGKEAHRGSP